MKRQSVLLFLYSDKNIVGSILGLLGLFMYAVGIIDRFWLLIVLGLYLIGVLATPRSPQYELSFKTQLTADQIRDKLEDLVRKIRGRVSKDILVKVQSIKASIMTILPQIADITSADYEIYTIRQTALEYLPETLENYLSLPKAFRTIHPVRGGTTAKGLLLEQLELLDQQMEEIVQDFYRNDTQRLMAHGRFLEQKFGETEVWFEGEN
jgi:hypothetical protein